MKGHKFLKSTGILMIVAAAFSIIAGVFVGGLGVLAAGLGAASGLTFAYWAALFLTLAGGICQRSPASRASGTAQAQRKGRKTHRMGRDRGCVQHPEHGDESGQRRRI